MVTCNRCGSTLDTGTPAESNYSVRVKTTPEGTYKTWCANCLLVSPPMVNER